MPNENQPQPNNAPQTGQSPAQNQEKQTVRPTNQEAKPETQQQAQPTPQAQPAPQPQTQPSQQTQPASQSEQQASPKPQTTRPQSTEPQSTTQQPQSTTPQPQVQKQTASQSGAPRPAPNQTRRPGAPLKPGQKPGTTRKPPNPKKLIYGCTGCSSLALLFFIVFVLVFVSQTSSSGENALATSLGVSTGSFINTLITLVNLIFGTISVLLFLLAIVGIFRFFMARKDDKVTRKKGFTMAGVSGLLLLVFVTMWVGIYLYMSSKRVPVESTSVTGILSEPADTLQLTAPINVKFDASSLPINTRKYDILSYQWDFGDGATATTAFTSHTYEQTGRFDVQLQVTKRDIATAEESVDTYMKTVTIANIALSARFTMDPESGPAPLTVAFDASESAAPAGEIVSYEWDFNNDNNFDDGDGAQVEHEFTQVGTYTVNLRVTDNVGNYEVTSEEVTVEGANIPTAVIDIPTEDGNYYVGRQYSFDAKNSTSPNGTITKYSWDFGDGSPKASTRTATHIYKTAGNYAVTLVVTDEAGKEGESTNNINVETPEAAPIAEIKTVPAPNDNEDFISGAVPFEVSFDGRDSADADNNIVDYNWDFDGDGSIDASGESVTYAYNQSGTYNATLTVVDAENNESTAIIVVRVGEQPLTARVTAEPVEGVAPLTVTFDAGSSSYPSGEIVSYEWDFGDGSPKRIDVSQVTYKYTKIGTFTTEVTAIASDNTRSTAEISVNVRPVPLTACFEAAPETGQAPLNVEFDPRCSSGTIASYSWDFGDGKSSRTRKPSHEYTSPGSYTVTLEVADNQNVIDTFTKSILVTGTL